MCKRFEEVSVSRERTAGLLHDSEHEIQLLQQQLKQEKDKLVSKEREHELTLRAEVDKAQNMLEVC
jgi:hypothetical protein